MLSQKILIKDIITTAPIIPIITIDDIKHAIDLAKALVAGGIKILEITLRTSVALNVIQLLTKQMPNIIVGAGTVKSIDDLNQAINVGAQFAVSPGSTSQLLTYANTVNFPLLPGISNSSEIMLGLSMGYQYFKLFPAQITGGIAALQAFSGPFASVHFCPTGGINQTNFLDYLCLDNVSCVGGSWVAPRALIKSGSFNKITQIAQSSIALYQQQNYAN